MLIGETITAEDTTGTTVYTPWFPRQGNNVTSTVDVIAISSGANLAITLQTKNSDETDDTATDKNTNTVTATGVDPQRDTNLEELVRYKIRLYRSSGTGTIYAHFRMLAPQWEATGTQGL